MMYILSLAIRILWGCLGFFVAFSYVALIYGMGDPVMTIGLTAVVLLCLGVVEFFFYD